MKLKTLKDFKREDYSEGQDKKGNVVKYFDERKLKAEAVKWLKNDLWQSSQTSKFIIEFFNLTEEDLK